MRSLLAIAVCFSIIASPSRSDDLSERQKNQVLDGVRDTLRDPESARFKWDEATLSISSVNGHGNVCIKINAKNGFGGYSGFQIANVEFYLVKGEITNIRVDGIGDERTTYNCEYQRRYVERIKHHDPRITEDQVRAGCSMEDNKLLCSSPGTGMCWEKGHDPWKSEAPARAVDAEKYPDLCSGTN